MAAKKPGQTRGRFHKSLLLIQGLHFNPLLYYFVLSELDLGVRFAVLSFSYKFLAKKTKNLT